MMVRDSRAAPFHRRAPAAAFDLACRLAYCTAYQLLRAWWFVRRPAARGAAVAVWCGDRLLVVRASYRPDLDLPGGGIRAAEPPELGAARELYEETGLRAPPADLVPTAVLEFTAEHRRITHTVFVWRIAEPLPPRVDRHEIVWAGYLSPAECSNAALSPALRHYLAAIGHAPHRP